MAVAAPALSFASSGVLRRAARLVPLVLAGYGLRLASSWLVLARAGGHRFDPHGFGLLRDGVLLLVLVPVVLALLGWVLWHRNRWHGILAPAATPARTVLSAVLLILLGAPLPGQVWALVLLPLLLSWPVLESALLWFGVVVIGCALAVAEPRISWAVPGARS